MKSLLHKLHVVIVEVHGYYLTTVLLYGDEYTVTSTVSTTYYLTTLLLQVVLNEWSYICLRCV